LFLLLKISTNQFKINNKEQGEFGGPSHEFDRPPMLSEVNYHFVFFLKKMILNQINQFKKKKSLKENFMNIKDQEIDLLELMNFQIN